MTVDQRRARELVEQRIMPAATTMSENAVAWTYQSNLAPGRDLAEKIRQDRAYYVAQAEVCADAIEACNQALDALGEEVP